MSHKENNPRAEEQPQQQLQAQLPISKRMRKRLEHLQEKMQKAREAQARAAERLQLAQARLQKKSARVQDLEARLAHLVQLPAHSQAVPLAADSQLYSATPAAPASAEQVETLQSLSPSLSSENVPETEPAPVTSVFVPEPVSPVLLASPVQDDLADAWEAHTVAKEAEEEALEAAELVQEVEMRLEQVGFRRHLLQELQDLRAEAERTNLQAQEAWQVAAVAAHDLPETARQQLFALERQSLLAESEDIVPALSFHNSQPFVSTLDSTISAQHIPTHVGEPELSNPGFASPSQSDLNMLAETETEEEILGTVTSMIIADSAAMVAARAEAFAESSSARARDARSVAWQADETLAQVRASLLEGRLTGIDASDALKVSEHAALHAHALLADAEAAEEQALNAATNAEAEADVTEGMAFSANRRWESRSNSSSSSEKET